MKFTALAALLASKAACAAIYSDSVNVEKRLWAGTGNTFKPSNANKPFIPAPPAPQNVPAPSVGTGLDSSTGAPSAPSKSDNDKELTIEILLDSDTMELIGTSSVDTSEDGQVNIASLMGDDDLETANDLNFAEEDDEQQQNALFPAQPQGELPTNTNNLFEPEEQQDLDMIQSPILSNPNQGQESTDSSFGFPNAIQKQHGFPPVSVTTLAPKSSKTGIPMQMGNDATIKSMGLPSQQEDDESLEEGMDMSGEVPIALNEQQEDDEVLEEGMDMSGEDPISSNQKQGLGLPNPTSTEFKPKPAVKVTPLPMVPSNEELQRSNWVIPGSADNKNKRPLANVPTDVDSSEPDLMDIGADVPTTPTRHHGSGIPGPSSTELKPKSANSLPPLSAPIESQKAWTWVVTFQLAQPKTRHLDLQPRGLLN